MSCVFKKNEEWVVQFCERYYREMHITYKGCNENNTWARIDKGPYNCFLKFLFIIIINFIIVIIYKISKYKIYIQDLNKKYAVPIQF